MRFYLMLFIIIGSSLSYAQEKDLSADELFLQARDRAFEYKDYTQAIKLTQQALERAPNYTDLSVFLARLYTWTDQIDSARSVFEELKKRGVYNEDFYIAYASLEYWNDNYIKANALLNEAVDKHRTSEALWLLRARVSYSNKDYVTARSSADTLLAMNPKNTDARVLLKTLQEILARNAVGASYNFVHFDKQFDQDWHILSLHYKRQLSFGSLIFRTNLANKFGDNGLQFEIEAYPRISKTFYLYLNAGYSEQVGIFPKFRSGVSLYANLPKSFEADIGYRQLYFTDNILMFTASVGKYYQNFWFNLKSFITPANSNISHSYTATARYYTKGANDYVGFLIGTGISPEENRSNLLVDDQFKLKTYKAGIDYTFSLKKTNIFNCAVTYYNQEYRPNTKGNQLDIVLSYTRIF